MSEELGKQISKSMSMGEAFQTEPTVGRCKGPGEGWMYLASPIKVWWLEQCGIQEGKLGKEEERCWPWGPLEVRARTWAVPLSKMRSLWGFLSQEVTEVTDLLWAVAFNQSSLPKSS